MEKIGLVNSIFSRMSRNWETHQLASDSQEMKEYNESLAHTLSLLKTVKATKDIKLAINVEEMFLRQEQAAYVNSPEEANSVAKALAQVNEARASLKVVADYNAYRSVDAAMSSSKKEGGLPVDAFRDFLKSHSTRLTNRMTSNLSVPEKNIVRQRKDNLAMMREVYIGMQREALGLQAPDKANGLGR